MNIVELSVSKVLDEQHDAVLIDERDDGAEIIQ